MASILIVDDQAVVRKGLKQAICEEIRDVVFGESKSFEQALLAIAKRPWDIVILGISLPDRDGFGVLQEIRRNSPEIRVLVLGAHADQRCAARAMELGARGYISKDASLSGLLSAVRRVLAGESYISRFASGQLAAPAREAGKDTHRKLSCRERNVLLAVSAGHRMAEVANKLGLSVKTVSTYKARILNKLQLNSTADLVRYVLTESDRI